MSERNRRTVLRAAAASAAVPLAGCSLLASSSPAGTLVVENDHDLPHLVSVAVVDGPESAPAVENARRGTWAIEAGERTTTEAFLTGSHEYHLEVRLDGGSPEHLVFRPEWPDRDPGGRTLDVDVTDGGTLDWSVEAVD